MREDRLLSPGEAAAILGTTAKGLDHRRRSGEIPFVPLGRLVRYRLSTITSYIATHEVTLRRRGRPRVVRMPSTREVSS